MLDYEINETLKENILKDIPENYTKLEKAILIYKRLCETLEYSFDYYLNEHEVKSEYRDVYNLKNVDGINNKEVVCFTFNAIFAKLLYEAEITKNIDTDFYNERTNTFSALHDSLNFEIDGTVFMVDSTFGVLDNNDLTLSKYVGHQPQGWQIYNAKENDLTNLNSALEKVYSENQNLESNLEKYVKMKKLQSNEFKELPLEERVKMFLELSQTCDYSIFGFNNLLKYKHVCFDGAELHGTQTQSVTIDKNIDLLFAKDAKSNEYKAFLFYNPEGYTDDQGYENFDKLQVFEISLKDKTIQTLDRDQIAKLFDQRCFVTNRNDTISPTMSTNGRLVIKEEYAGGQPIYNHNQQPINVIKRVRKHIKSGELEELPLE